MVLPVLRSDLQEVLAATEMKWPKGARIFVTGGTGFFGKWLQETFAFANKELALGATLTVLTREKSVAQQQLPHLANSGITYVEGDVRTIAAMPGDFTHVIHAATPTSQLWQTDASSGNISVEGTQAVLDFLKNRSRARLLHCSSGAVYRPMDLTSAPPTESDAIDEPRAGGSIYANGKKLSEILVHASGVDSVMARCFAFLGPHLPFDGSFAAGQFLKSALEGHRVVVKGSGRDERSYMYPTDLTIWLWTLLFTAPKHSVFNVGSPDAVRIRELADVISKEFGLPEPVVEGTQSAYTRYFPDVTKAERELGLRCRVGLAESVRRTKKWAQQSAR